MGDEKSTPRVQKVLEYLYNAEVPVRPKEIADQLHESPLNVGKDLHALKERGLGEAEEAGLWQITGVGREWLEGDGGKETGKKDERKEIGETVPTQADVFRAEGQRLGIGSRRGDIRLDAIVTYVERIADLDDLSSVWNALTEMGVANDIKKRWVKLYAQNLPGKDIPEELKEKLGEGVDAERVRVETGEVSLKPKRFSVVNNEIIGDPEGDLSFKEALQYVAQQKGASPADAESLALQISKQGPEMLGSIMSMLTPLINKEPPQQDSTIIQAMQQRIEQLADSKHDAEMESLRAEMRSGQRSPEADQQIQALSQQISELRDALHNQELARIQEQSQGLIGALHEKLTKLEEQMMVSARGRQAESEIGLMSETVRGVFEEIKGARQDFKSMAPVLLARGAATRKRTLDEKAGFGAGLGKGIEKERVARGLEEQLFFSGKGEG